MFGSIGFSFATATAGWLISQAPTPTSPPALLPSNITGNTTPPPVITPVSTPAQSKPIDRFTDIGRFPAETAQCIYGIRTGADWLAKVHQANGRFFPGVNTALASVWDKDSDAKQAMAMLGLCQAARFNGDVGMSSKASQALLTVMSGLKPDAADPNRLTVVAPASEKSIVAACLILAASEMPGADPRTLAVAEHMTLFLRTTTESESFARGMAMRALAVSHRMKPADWKRTAATTAVSSALTDWRAKPNAILAAGIMVAASDLFVVTKDQSLVTTINELADHLCSKQFDRSTVRSSFTWAGAVRVVEGDESEPTFEQAMISMGLVSATQLARQSTDLVRYTRYRQATVDSLMFVRGLQMTPENAAHFESGFRNRSVVGGVRSGVTDPILRSDATALALGAMLLFVDSGCENRE